MFVGLHVAIAHATEEPLWAITQEEGKEFLTSAQQVLRHYSVETTQKTLDWIAFMGSVGTIYGTRAFAAMNNRQARRREPPPAQPQQQQAPQPVAPRPNVVPFTSAVTNEPIVPNAEDG